MSENDSHGFYEVVPDGFDLLGATPDKLDLYGIPQRPDPETEPQLLAFWTRLVSGKFKARRPTFSSIEQPLLGGAQESMLNWSGGLISAPWPKRLVFVSAGWHAPGVRPPSAHALFTPSNDSKSLLWVGLDGHNGLLPNISLPQIGTGHWPNRKPQHFAWWDWWRNSPAEAVKAPNKAITLIDNLPINTGDEILAGLAVLVSEDVLCFIKNHTTGEFRSFLAKRQPLGDIEPLGSTVEWVMERPTDPASGKLFPLPDYDTVNFKYCLARAADGPLGPGRLMTLADNALMIQMRAAFADPYRTVIVSRATTRKEKDPNDPIGVTCTFQSPT